MRSKLNGIGADSCPNTVTVDGDELADVPRDLYIIDVPGMACLLGIRFADRSGTGPVAGKRDCCHFFSYVRGQRPVSNPAVNAAKQSEMKIQQIVVIYKIRQYFTDFK